MRKASSGMVQRGGGRGSFDPETQEVTVDRTSWPAQYGHQMCNSKGFQYAANWLLQSLLKPSLPKKALVPEE